MEKVGGIFLLDRSGIFTAVTDFGNFAYWFSLRENESVEEFLLSTRPNQILCKIANQDVVDNDGLEKYLDT
ncbi:hypothetical protein [Bacillus fungorum]|uniref:hypothetical protein n=1 Tax=Bacillus fungorum TaxID=2039284 RepID=UPI001FEBE1FF|nr:hypothetical protein [Bacillus fungorum]